jgi:hypothetical protein
MGRVPQGGHFEGDTTIHLPQGFSDGKTAAARRAEQEMKRVRVVRKMDSLGNCHAGAIPLQ